MIGRRTFLGASGAALVLAGIAPARAAAAWPLVVRGSRLFLDIEIQGKPVQALLDSAAEATLVDRTYAQTIGLKASSAVPARGSGGDTQAALAKGVTIKVTGLTLRPSEVGIVDLSDVGARLIGGPLPVILGREYFDAARLEVDINGGHIRVLGKSGVPRGVRLPLTGQRGIETVPAAIENHPPTAAAFDLGNGGAVLVGAAYAKSLGLLGAGKALAKESGGGIGGQVNRTAFTLASLTLAGRTFPNVAAEIDETDSATDLNVGVSILQHFLITTDFAGRAVWLDPR